MTSDHTDDPTDWYKCAHVWAEEIDSQFSNEYATSVVCEKCKCPGERNEKTGEVFWPAT